MRHPMEKIAKAMEAYHAGYTEQKGTPKLRTTIINEIKDLASNSREVFLRFVLKMRLLDDLVGPLKYQQSMAEYDYATSGVLTGGLVKAFMAAPQEPRMLKPREKQHLEEMLLTYSVNRERDPLWEGSFESITIAARFFGQALLLTVLPEDWIEPVEIGSTEQYQFMKLGSGQFGTVYACIDGRWLHGGLSATVDPRNVITALKNLDFQHNRERGASIYAIRGEVGYWRDLSNMNTTGLMLPFLGSVETPSSVIIQSKIAAGGVLKAWLDVHYGDLQIRHLTTMLGWVVQMFDQLIALRRTKTAHRDIKPDNYFVGPDEELWLGDFGLVTRCEKEVGCPSTSKCGTPAFMDPALHQMKNPASAADMYNSDLWAVGVSAHAILYTAIKRDLWRHPAITAGGALDKRNLGRNIINGFQNDIIDNTGIVATWKSLLDACGCGAAKYVSEYDAAFRKQGAILKEALGVVHTGKHVTLLMLQTWRHGLQQAADQVPE